MPVVSRVALVARRIEHLLVMAQGCSIARTSLTMRAKCQRCPGTFKYRMSFTIAVFALSVICARWFCFAAFMAPVFVLFLWMLCVFRSCALWLGGQLDRILCVLGVLSPAGEGERQQQEDAEVQSTRAVRRADSKRMAKLLKLKRLVWCHFRLLFHCVQRDHVSSHVCMISRACRLCTFQFERFLCHREVR